MINRRLYIIFCTFDKNELSYITVKRFYRNAIMTAQIAGEEIDISKWNFPPGVAAQLQAWVKSSHCPDFTSFLNLAEEILTTASPIRYFAANSPAIEIWRGQRAIDQTRVAAIVESWRELPKIEPFILTACKMPGMKLQLIDGQHRWEAAKSFPTLRIPIYIIDVASNGEIVALFTQYNKLMPVSNVVIEALMDELKADRLAQISAVVQRLVKVYILSFSDAEKPQRPNVNMQAFIKKLHEAEILKHCKGDLYDALIATNAWLKMQPIEYFLLQAPKHKPPTTVKAHETAVKKGFFLGMVPAAEIARIVANI